MSFDVNVVKKTFFDRKAVKDAIDKGLAKALAKFGAFVRTRAKTSIRKRKAISAPGSPPSSHTGDLKKLIYFSFDRAAKSVVIGPVLKSGNAGAPRLLEHGGTSSKGKKYAARPFMLPAFQKELPNAPKGLKNLIR